MFKLFLCLLIGCNFLADALDPPDSDLLKEPPPNSTPKYEERHGTRKDNRNLAVGSTNITEKFSRDGGQNQSQPVMRYKRSYQNWPDPKPGEVIHVFTTESIKTQRSAHVALELHSSTGEFIRREPGKHVAFAGRFISRGDYDVFFFAPYSQPLISRSATYEIFHIKILDQESKMVRDISMRGSDSMNDLRSKYNLETVHFEYGYMIEISSRDPSGVLSVTTQNSRLAQQVAQNTLINQKREIPEFLGNIRANTFVHKTSSPQKFIVIDGQFILYEIYVRQNLKLLLEWQRNFNKWRNELARQISIDLPGYSAQQKFTWVKNKQHELNVLIHSLNADIEIIQNSENIHKMQIKVRRLEKTIRDKFTDLAEEISKLKTKVEELDPGDEACSKVGGVISPISSLIPGAGTIASAVTGVIAATCTIAGV
ncbi:hypothetical protein QAD02_006716 [Eretmocerus hayati]|uniref:Uncharacterized protein n=1 Tax=Eretmocerus hayati TaxID=131215 RepID=A0ACC2N1Y4_9HYME|nr:hypothetical protein QAD02_006716 [Eretmocerus hayati]